MRRRKYLRGAAVEIMDEREKIHAPRPLCQRQTLTNMSGFNEEISHYLSRTATRRIEVAEIIGKSNKYDANGKEIKLGRMN